jgi:hypothetical protein
LLKLISGADLIYFGCVPKLAQQPRQACGQAIRYYLLFASHKRIFAAILHTMDFVYTQVLLLEMDAAAVGASSLVIMTRRGARGLVAASAKARAAQKRKI